MWNRKGSQWYMKNMKPWHGEDEEYEGRRKNSMRHEGKRYEWRNIDESGRGEIDEAEWWEDDGKELRRKKALINTL